MFIVYEISKNYSISTYPKLEKCLFGAVSLTKNADIDKYKYSRYDIGFDREGEFSFGASGFGRNCIIFGADLSSSSHANSKKKIYSSPWKRFCTRNKWCNNLCKKDCIQLILLKIIMSLHYNGANSYLFVNGTEIHKFKAKDCSKSVDCSKSIMSRKHFKRLFCR